MALGSLMFRCRPRLRQTAPCMFLIPAMLGGIEVDESGRIYVVDQLFKKVEVFRRVSEKEGQQMLLR